MLKTLRIRNFKGWKDTGEIQLAPITLFFGSNSSGKSSIGQFLMMLKQTTESSDRKSVFFPGISNSHVQLGSFQDMVFQHDLKNKISFSYTWEIPYNISFRDTITRKNYTGNELFFSAITQITGKTEIPTVESIKYCLNNHTDNENHRVVEIELEKLEKTEKGGYTLKSNDYGFVRNTGRAWKIPSVVRFYGFADEVNAYYQNANFVQLFNLEQENLFRRIYYLGPLRSKPGRIYPWPGNEPDGVGDTGENTIAAILAARERKINLGYKRPTRPFEEIIASSLKKLGLIDDFEVKNISEQRREYEVKVCTTGSSDAVDLPDVGFGVSQVLPVLAACFYAPKNSIIIMEQPEIHLHPSAQAALADVMIDVIKSRENNEDRNIQLLIETHSEHFLRRLQRRVAEDIISTDKMSAYFVDTTHRPVTLNELDIDLFGNINNWPKDFFGDEIGDIAGQVQAAMKKRKEQIGNTKGGKNDIS